MPKQDTETREERETIRQALRGDEKAMRRAKRRGWLRGDEGEAELTETGYALLLAGMP